jgi:hypothetical protein
MASKDLLGIPVPYTDLAHGLNVRLVDALLSPDAYEPVPA